ncbi:uncharacterized protein LACBIDRAFT_302465 [Laccaria bicolor S238N-H82]|uniref:Predicted protein n=1 Tax=Laccaria bicolor (strain S238N-H82 / ATCC MYA-4686) TaxID=486041 RepID=B0DHP8_LACBS|nr:uncharacterized protein LACBIDRAFT_302465 [Laccaria bicolor S238N-H82]EDR05874.1 predicted protein [Laccaria bicolor S238N-H82]|eukprot:XP_001883550.1 predicted protein [Laccaria bicolor S238N-H82]
MDRILVLEGGKILYHHCFEYEGITTFICERPCFVVLAVCQSFMPKEAFHLAYERISISICERPCFVLLAVCQTFMPRGRISLSIRANLHLHLRKTVFCPSGCMSDFYAQGENFT